MRRLSFCLLIVVGLAFVSSGVEAGGKKRKRRAKKEGAPTSEQIVKALGDLKWGMPKDKLLKRLTKQVKEKYRPLIAKTHDAVEEDRLRHEATEKIQAIRKSYIEFNGRSTGWDASFLKEEFTQNNGESMLVVRDKNSQNFYFFMNGKLWKWYKAFDASTFGGHGFNGFSRVVQKKFGEGKETEGELVPGTKRRWVEWQDGKTRLRAVDQTAFYGFYCLVFEEKETVAQLASLRKGQAPGVRKRHALVDSVTSGDSFEADDSPDIVDRLTGKTRAGREEPSGRGGKSASRGAKSESSSSPGRARSTEELIGDDDPLRGL